MHDIRMETGEDIDSDITEHNESSSYSDSGNESDSSSAGLARGLTRTLQAQIRRTSIGSIPRNQRTLFSVRRVAKLSDKVSNAIDVSSEAMDAVNSNDGRSSGVGPSQVKSVDAKALWMKRVYKFVQFSTGVVKNSLLGAAVFETYDVAISHMTSDRCDDAQSQSNGDGIGAHVSMECLSDDAYARASILNHAQAGGAAGSVHAILHQITEVMVQRKIPAASWVSLNMLHHTIAHSILFGGYELFKRSFSSMTLWSTAATSHVPMYTTDDVEIEEQEDHVVIGISQISIVAMAGGCAGVLQHVMSHVTNPDSILREGDERLLTVFRAWTKKLRHSSMPALRPTLCSFPVSALTFIAFEYGKEWNELHKVSE